MSAVGSHVIRTSTSSNETPHLLQACCSCWDGSRAVSGASVEKWSQRPGLFGAGRTKRQTHSVSAPTICQYRASSHRQVSQAYAITTTVSAMQSVQWRASACWIHQSRTSQATNHRQTRAYVGALASAFRYLARLTWALRIFSGVVRGHADSKALHPRICRDQCGSTN